MRNQENLYHKQEFVQFAKDVIKLCDIDESHGLDHLNNVAANCRLILEEFAGTSIIEGFTKSEEIDLICDAAFVHDLVDSKYMDETEGVERLSAFLKKQGYPLINQNIIIYIITNMSFSKRRCRAALNLPMIEAGPYTTAVQIVVDADQLDAYDPMRCLMYQKNKWKDRIDVDIISRRWLKTILIKRVLLYRDHYMYTATARELALPLHEKLALFVHELDDVEMFEY